MTIAASKYKAVQGLIRGLELLNALNQLNGSGSVADLSDQTGLHRTTVRRLLETLIGENYVRQSGSDDSYWLDLRVRELSEGFRDEQWISSLAAPLLGQLLKQVLWPTDLTTLDIDAMVIRETTHRSSKLSFHRSIVGRRIPILFTASGRAYLAFCPESEREQLIKVLATSSSEEGKMARDPGFVRRIVAQTREQGYGANFCEWTQESRFAAIALPIRHKGHVYGCLNLVYVAKAMHPDEAANRYLAPMRATITQIQKELARLKNNA